MEMIENLGTTIIDYGNFDLMNIIGHVEPPHTYTYIYIYINFAHAVHCK